MMENDDFKNVLKNSKPLCIFLMIATLICLYFAYSAAYSYLTLGQEMAEPNEASRGAANTMARATIMATALVFLLKPFFKSIGITILAICLVCYEGTGMFTNQKVAFKGSALPQINNQRQIDNIQAEIATLEKQSESFQVNNRPSKAAQYIEKARSKRDELKQLTAKNGVTFGSEFPEWVINVKCALRSGLLPGIIGFCFYIIGALAGYLFMPSNKKQVEKEEDFATNAQMA